MKHLLLIACILSIQFVNAQTEGTIVFEETIKLDFNFEGPEGMDVKSMMPSSQTSKNQLIFNKKASLYKGMEDDSEENQDTESSFTSDSGSEIQLKIKRPQSSIYRDISTGKVVESREFMNKNFLISDNNKKDWKLSKDQKDVLDYTCSKATWQDSTTAVTAWYTSQIPASIGPSSYGGLPGAILYLDIDQGKRIYEAIKVDFTKPSEGSIQKPKNGKKVSRSEFMEIAEAKMQEMRETMGGQGSGGQMIIMRGN